MNVRSRLLTFLLPRLFCDIGYQGVGGIRDFVFGFKYLSCKTSIDSVVKYTSVSRYYTILNNGTSPQSNIFGISRINKHKIIHVFCKSDLSRLSKSL